VARTQNWRNVVVLAVTAIVILATVWAVQAWGPFAADQSGGTPSVASAADAPKVGDVATDFTGTTLDGEEIVLSKLRGKPIWLVFGATWCANCRAEAPDVAQVAHDYAGRAEVVSVYTGESVQTVGEYAGRLGLTYPQLPDPGKQIAAAYRVMGIPAHFFIDANGVIRSIRVGTISPTDAAGELDVLLKEETDG